MRVHTRLPKPKLHSAQPSTLSGLSECKTFTFKQQIDPELHKYTGYTQADTSRSSNNTARPCREIKTKAPPALHPNSSLRTEHLHPTRRYKNRRNQGQFESPFEFVKDKTWDTIMMIIVTAPYYDWTLGGISEKKRSPASWCYSAEVCSVFYSRKTLQPSPPLSLL